MVLLHPPQFRSRRQVATSGGEFRNFTILELIDSTSCESLAVALARRYDVLDELDEADVHDGLDITSCDRALRYLETRCLIGCLPKQLLR